jgi:hypothetical protein
LMDGLCRVAAIDRGGRHAEGGKDALRSRMDKLTRQRASMCGAQDVDAERRGCDVVGRVRVPLSYPRSMDRSCNDKRREVVT